jgi:hypothetical protein
MYVPAHMNKLRWLLLQFAPIGYDIDELCSQYLKDLIHAFGTTSKHSDRLVVKTSFKRDTGVSNFGACIVPHSQKCSSLNSREYFE